MSNKPFSPFLDKVEEYGKDKPLFRFWWCVGNAWLVITVIMYIGSDINSQFKSTKAPSLAKIIKTQWEIVTFTYKGNYKPDMVDKTK